jgi:hypothetical protein
VLLFLSTPGQIPDRFSDLKKVAVLKLVLDHCVAFLVLVGQGLRIGA